MRPLAPKGFERLEALPRQAVELGEWEAAGEGEEDGVLAHLPQLREMVAPAAVDREQRQPALDLVEDRPADERKQARAGLRRPVGEEVLLLAPLQHGR